MSSTGNHSHRRPLVRSLASRRARSAALTLVVYAGAAASGLSASAALSPQSLYRALLRKSFQRGELLNGSPLVAPTAGKLSQIARRYHALGEVNASFSDVQDGIAYVVYPTLVDARSAWLAARPPGLVKTATGGLPNPVRVSTRLVDLRSVSGKTTVRHVAEVSFANGNVIVGSYARSSGTSRSILTAGALAKAAFAHLRALENKPG